MGWSSSQSGGADDASDPMRLGRVLDAVLASLGAPSTEAIVVVHERWSDVVGDELAARSHPISIEDGCLRIGVDNPAWAGHLRWSEQEILSRLDRLVGAGVVRSVQARVVRS